MDKLTQKQHNFVMAYIKNGCNFYQAALEAGYSDSYARTKASVLINHPLVSQQLKKAYQTVEIQRLNDLCISLADKAKVLTSIIYDVIPQDGSEPKRDYYKDAIKAISELNKMQGDYAPDKRLSITVDATKDRLIEARKQYEEY